MANPAPIQNSGPAPQQMHFPTVSHTEPEPSKSVENVPQTIQLENETTVTNAPSISSRIVTTQSVESKELTAFSENPEAAPAKEARKTERTVVEFHKSTLKERLIGTVKTVGSYLLVPLKLPAKAIYSIIWKPLEKCLITPIHTAYLYVGDRTRYDAYKMDLDTQARKAAKEVEQVSDRKQQEIYQAAARQIVDIEDARAEVNKYKPSQRMIKEFDKKLKDGTLALKKQVGEDLETGEKYYVTQTVRPASARVLDADKADVAKRLDNHGDPVFRCTDKNVIEAYNCGSKKHLDNLALKETGLLAEILQMKEDFKESYPDHKAIEYIENFNNQETDRRITEIETELQKLKERLEEEKRIIEQTVNGGDKALYDLEKKINQEKMEIACYKHELNIHTKKHELLAVQHLPGYPHEQLLAELAQDIDDWKNGPLDTKTGQRLQGTRDRLNTQNWNAVVARDKKGNITSLPENAAHLERKFEQMITPAYDGKTMSAPALYKDEKGLEWSSTKRGQDRYASYQALRSEENNKIRKNDEGHIVGWEPVDNWKPASNAPEKAEYVLKKHWFVKPNNINGKHEGYDKNQLIVNKPVALTIHPPATAHKADVAPLFSAKSKLTPPLAFNPALTELNQLSVTVYELKGTQFEEATKGDNKAESSSPKLTGSEVKNANFENTDNDNSSFSPVMAEENKRDSSEPFTEVEHPKQDELPSVVITSTDEPTT